MKSSQTVPLASSSSHFHIVGESQDPDVDMRSVTDSEASSTSAVEIDTKDYIEAMIDLEKEKMILKGKGKIA